jgi:RNA recognition motif-containing protein
MTNIYVGNLSFRTSEAELEQAFSAYGAVEKVIILKEKETGRSRGFAFVEMTNKEDADRAIAAMNGRDLGGRALQVNEARPREPRESRGGGGYGDRRGGGGGGGYGDRRRY